MGTKKEKKAGSKAAALKAAALKAAALKAARGKAAPVAKGSKASGDIAMEGASTSAEQRDELRHAHHAAWYQLLRAHAAVNHRIEKRLSSEPISLGWYDVLVTLEKAPDGRLRMSELADNILLSRSGLTRVVDKLEEAGLLQREKCPGDRRGFYAAITKAGLAARRAAWPKHARSIAELFARHLSEDEAKTIAEIMARVADAAFDEPDADETESTST